ncbi:GTP cyclohydrolase II [Coemansia sp. Benny D115]|nr:GTP cyclohydrolase II [Coemansia sp. Benny D115]
MPSPASFVDIEGATAAAHPTPTSEFPPKDAISASTAEPSPENHFNASLDQALHLLEQQNGQQQFYNSSNNVHGGSATPVNWSSTDIPPVQTPISYSDDAQDDLIISRDYNGLAESPRSCVSRASSVTAIDAASKSSVVEPKIQSAEVKAVCQVRARIPYPGGQFYLHLYHTDEDDKEHLAIVFGDDIRSATLEKPSGPQETDMDRRIRGASTGSLRRLVERDIAQRSGNPHAGNKHRQFSGLDTSTAKDMVSEIGVRPGFESDPSDQFNSGRLSVINAPLVRIHSECFTGETVSSVRCDCGYQLAEAMRVIQQEGRGVIVYLRQEGRGIGLLEKLKAYNLQDMGHDTVDANLLLNHPADARTYGSARAILADLGISKLRLLTNNTDKIRQICGRGSQLDVVCHVPMYPRWWGMDTAESGDDSSESGQLSYDRHLALKKNVMREADKYLKTKAERMGHMLTMSSSTPSIPGIINF